MIGCFASVVCSCIIGVIWYNPALPFGKLWMQRTHPGKTTKEVAEEGKMALGFSFVACLFLSLLMRFILIDYFHVKVMMDGVKFAVGLASLTAILEFPHAVYSQRPFDVYLIDQLYNLAVLAAAAVCITYFP